MSDMHAGVATVVQGEGTKDILPTGHRGIVERVIVDNPGTAGCQVQLLQVTTEGLEPWISFSVDETDHGNWSTEIGALTTNGLAVRLWPEEGSNMEFAKATVIWR